MPATYAAVSACLDAVRAARPDFSPRSLIDVGAGPGTVTWATAGAFPSIETFTLVDTNDHLRALALDLMRRNQRLRRTEYRSGSARAYLNGAVDADLVVASYVCGEIDEAELAMIGELMWRRPRSPLLQSEPG